MGLNIIEALRATTQSIRDWASNKLNNKVDKVDGGKSGNFVKLNTDGNIVDSGYNVNSFVPIASLTGLIIPHINNNDIHITAEEKAAWNANLGFSGSYNDLTDIPTTIKLVDNATSITYELTVNNGKLILREVTE